MPEWNDTILILFFTIVPLIFMLLQVFLSIKKQIYWGFIVPFLWTISGIWIEVSIYKNVTQISPIILSIFLIGDVILIGILVLIRCLKKKKQ